MKLFGRTHIILSIITFAIIFFMNYLGNDSADKVSRALLNAVAAVVGLSLGMFILYKNKGGTPPDQYD